METQRSEKDIKKVLELPSQEDLLANFYYDNKLRWKVSKKSGPLNVKEGDEVAGYANSSGYLLIRFNGTRYMLSRIIYQTVYGNLTSDLVVDHINRNLLDNRIENLRAIPQKHNMRNCRIRSDNTSGNTGVVLRTTVRKRTGKVEKAYSACWYTTDCGRKFKSFSINKYGEEEAFRLACEHRKAMIQSLIEQGEWYDPTHGT